MSTGSKKRMQPIVLNEKGVPQFQPNEAINRLFDAHAVYAATLLEAEDFSEDDRQQFAQLIGYTVQAYCKLPFASAEVAAEAQRKGALLVRAAAEAARLKRFREDRAAMPERNAHLFDLHKSGLTYEALGKKFGITGSRAREIFLQEERRRYAEHLKATVAKAAAGSTDNTSIDVLDLSVRADHALSAAGIRTIGELRALGRSGLLSIKHLGRKTMKELIEEVNRYYASQGKDCRFDLSLMSRRRTDTFTGVRSS